MSAPVGTLVSLALSLLQNRVPAAILAEVRRFVELLEGRILVQEERIATLERRIMVMERNLELMVQARRVTKHVEP